MDCKALSEQLVRHEGKRLDLYPDSVVGKLTIGVGRNIEDNGISEDEAMFMLNNDIMSAFGDVIAVIGKDVFEGLSEIRQGVLLNMMFNLGMPRFRTFKKMIAAIRADDPEEVAVQMQDSRWFNQVGDRGVELVWQFRNNRFGDFAR